MNHAYRHFSSPMPVCQSTTPMLAECCTEDTSKMCYLDSGVLTHQLQTLQTNGCLTIVALQIRPPTLPNSAPPVSDANSQYYLLSTRQSVVLAHTLQIQKLLSLVFTFLPLAQPVYIASNTALAHDVGTRHVRVRLQPRHGDTDTDANICIQSLPVTPPCAAFDRRSRGKAAQPLHDV